MGKVELVEIHLAERHDPNEVFNRLNTKGTPLTLGDLIRNEAFGRFSSNRSAASHAFHAYWSPFEAQFPSEASREEYYWPFTLAVAPNATRGQAFVLLRERWSALGNESNSVDADAAIRLIVEDLTQFVGSFCLLKDGVGIAGLHPELARAALCLYRMPPPSVALSFLMQVIAGVMDGRVSVENGIETLRLVESFLVRRALVGLEPTGLHAVFKRLWNATQGNPVEVRRNLETATITFPNDQEVRDKLPQVNMYKRKLCRYILAEYERSLSKGDPLSEQQLTKFTIDHVVPQSFASRWAKEYELPREEVDRLLQTWGNLVPLSTEGNSTKAASDWEEAQRRLGNETIYASTKRLLDEIVSWSPEELRKRTNALTEWAVRRWPDSVGSVRG